MGGAASVHMGGTNLAAHAAVRQPVPNLTAHTPCAHDGYTDVTGLMQDCRSSRPTAWRVATGSAPKLPTVGTADGRKCTHNFLFCRGEVHLWEASALLP